MLHVSRTQLWSMPMGDKAVSLVDQLHDLMLKEDFKPQFMLSEHIDPAHGGEAVLVTPIQHAGQLAAAKWAGFSRNDQIACLCVNGDDEPGIIYRILSALSRNGLSLRVVSATCMDREFVMHLGFDSPTDAAAAVKILDLPL